MKHDRSNIACEDEDEGFLLRLQLLKNLFCDARVRSFITRSFIEYLNVGVELK